MSLQPLYVCAYLIVINLVTFASYRMDKRKAANGQRRISESALLVLALLGGSPLAWFAQRHFRHKTKKSSFRVRFWLIVIVQIAVGAVLLIKLNGWDQLP
ncbi:DUF1294 domain-containing protein [bacterium]|nr:DUF1294 domain-containing protein [bacterium]